MLECFSNKKLDFSPGFQLLHATYIVEKFLQKLRQRKCVFEIVFFDCNARFCIPAGTSDDNNDRYLLAREAIIQHLVTISQDNEHGFGVHMFESYHSESFEEHLLDSGAFVFMCHEGALDDINEIDEVSDDDDDDDDDDDSSDEDYQEGNRDDDFTNENKSGNIHFRVSSSVIGLRIMIRWFIAHGSNIALVNNLEFRDTKVRFQFS